jgi:plastocyanin
MWVLLGVALVGGLALGSLGIARDWMHQSNSTLFQQKQPQAAGVADVTHVFIRSQNGDAYDPGAIQIVRGTAVTWTNQDTVPHSVVISNAITATSDLWTSGALSTGQSVTYTFTSPGHYLYHCSLHVGMIGSVTVT